MCTLNKQQSGVIDINALDYPTQSFPKCKVHIYTSINYLKITESCCRIGFAENFGLCNHAVQPKPVVIISCLSNCHQAPLNLEYCYAKPPFRTLAG